MKRPPNLIASPLDHTLRIRLCSECIGDLKCFPSVGVDYCEQCGARRAQGGEFYELAADLDLPTLRHALSRLRRLFVRVDEQRAAAHSLWMEERAHDRLTDSVRWTGATSGVSLSLKALEELEAWGKR